MSNSSNLAPDRIIDDVVHAIRRDDGTASLAREIDAFETLVRAMAKMLTPAQRAGLADTDAVKGFLDAAPGIGCGYLGTLGGFGSEELEEWEFRAGANEQRHLSVK